MGLSLGFSKSDSSSSNEFSQDVFGPQGDALDRLYGSAGDYFDKFKGANQQQGLFGMDAQKNSYNQMQNPWQRQMQGGAYGGMDLQNQMNQSINTMQNRGPTAMQDINSMIMGGSGNNYADAMKGSYIQDADLASQNMLRNLDARATGSGMSGGARQGVATRGGFEDINRNLQRNLAQTGFGAFDKDLDRKLQIAQQADNNLFARDQQNQNTISGLMGGQNQAMQSGLNFGNNMFGFGNQMQFSPWQQMGMYGDVIGDPTVLGSGKGQSSGSSFGASGSMNKG